MSRVYEEIGVARRRALEKYGQEDHPPERWAIILAKEVGDVSRKVAMTLRHHRNESVRMKLGRLQEVRHQLIDCAAVAVLAVESLDRNELCLDDVGGSREVA